VLFLTLQGFLKQYVFAGHADTGLITGTAGPQNFFVSAGGYAYMTSGDGFYSIGGAKYVYGFAANRADVAYHYDGSGASALVMSGPAYSFMLGTDHGASFFNEAVGFKTNYGIAQHAGQPIFLVPKRALCAYKGLWRTLYPAIRVRRTGCCSASPPAIKKSGATCCRATGSAYAAWSRCASTAVCRAASILPTSFRKRTCRPRCNWPTTCAVRRSPSTSGSAW
jgi:hypothetical protein